MKRFMIYVKGMFILVSSFFLIFVAGCSNSPTSPQSASTSVQSTLLKIAQSDSSVASFQSNYNEDDAMTIYEDESDTKIFPIKEGQKLRIVSQNFTYTTSGDTAYGTYVQTFEGTLCVQTTNSNGRDTVIQKPYSTTVTRNLIFVKVGSDTNNPLHNWKLVAVSLPEGGTAISNVKITSITVYLSNGDTLQVNNPNSYFISRATGKMYERWKDMPFFHAGQSMTVKVTINSAYADTDFVTITHDADINGLHRTKQKFNLISSNTSGNGYVKVYQKTFTTGPWHGYFNAVINAFSNASVSDSSSPVEESSWGVPYLVN
jgi:hypothetical protein